MNKQEEEISKSAHEVLADMEHGHGDDYKISLRRFIFVLGQYGVEHGLWEITGNKDAIKLYIKLNDLDKEPKEEEVDIDEETEKLEKEIKDKYKTKI